MQCSAVRCRALPCCAVLSLSYLSKELCTYRHAASGLTSWSMELLAFPSRLFAPKMVDRLTHLPFRSILPCAQITPNSALSLAQLSSAQQLSSGQLSSASQHSAVRCRAMLCGAVPCCEVLSLSYVPDIIRTYQVPGYVRSTVRRITPKTTSNSAQLSYLSSTAQCRAVPRGAVL